MITISHDMDYVAENSKRVIVMAEGQIIKNDIPSKIFSDHDSMRKAQIEPPQITQLDMAITADDCPSLSVGGFVEKYQSYTKRGG
jgi:energy-coupling factor transport system ATP-binding protein